MLFPRTSVRPVVRNAYQALLKRPGCCLLNGCITKRIPGKLNTASYVSPSKKKLLMIFNCIDDKVKLVSNFLVRKSMND